MKKSIIIISTAIASFGLMAYTFYEEPNVDQCSTTTVVSKSELIPIENAQNILEIPEVSFSFGPRFEAIQKDKALHATSLEDFVSVEGFQSIVSLQSLELIVIEDEKQSHIRESGNSIKLNKKQLKLLRSFDYSSNFTIQAKITIQDKKTGELHESKLGPHLTIIPEKQAVYSPGVDALIDFMKKNTEARMSPVDKNKVGFAKIYFTVHSDGTVSEMNLDRSTGYPELDNIMMNLMREMPGKWIPAEDGKGKKVNQELVLSFGLAGMGC